MLTRFRIFYFLLIYFGLRIFSFYFQPTTPLNHSPHPLNTVLAIAIVATTAYLLCRKNILGWYIVAAELILGGSGLFLQAFGITIRSLLLITGLVIYFWQTRTEILKPDKTKLIIIELLAITALGVARGIFFGNAGAQVISDAIPYLFLLYYFPLRGLIKDEAWKKWCFMALLATVLGQAIFILLTYMGFTGGLFHLQDTFYHWYRDIDAGKITLVSYNFYRLVLNEQLLLIPALLLFIYRAIAGKISAKGGSASGWKKPEYFILGLLFVLSLNLTRIYIVALFAGMLALFSRRNWKRWLAVSLGSSFTFLIIFSLLFLVSSGGKSFGLEVFGLRLQSIVTPNLEESSFSRILLLPKIFDQILEHPFLGSGLGSTVTVFSPTLKTDIGTTNYDWGYLEILAELGVIGLSVWLLFIYYAAAGQKNRPRWQIASLISLLIINLTSPAVFHVFGITFLAFLLALSSSASAEQSVAPIHNP